VEQIILAARLYKITNERAYLDHAIQVYNWLTGPSNIVTADGKVYDGTYATLCNRIERTEHSYNAGLFLGGLALLLDATKDIKYMSDIQRVLGNYEKVFVKDNIFIDPCETSQNCKRNQAQFKGVGIFSLNYVYKYSTDESVKNKIKTWIETSASAMAKICDANWQCSNFWLPETTNRPIDVHNQMNALFMSNTLSQIRSATVSGGQRTPPKTSIFSENNAPAKKSQKRGDAVSGKKISFALLSSILGFVFLL
jgi:mannan endo-1,6-alpha-mannosidase